MKTTAEEEIRRLLPELGAIGDPSLADAVVEIWAEVWRTSQWEQLSDVPKNPKRLDRRPLIPHVRSVTQMAIAAGRIIQEQHGIAVDMDLLIAGALLHDVSKLAEYEPHMESAGRSSKTGELIQHGVLAASQILQRGLPLELTHLVLSHTDASKVLPKTIEAVILHYVDYADSDVLLLDAGQPLLARR